MYKLHNLGIKGKLWQIIDDCQCNTVSAVIVNQKQSRWFDVHQGVRQGGVLSTFLYLVFVNELLDELEHCNSTSLKCVLDPQYVSPTLADDIACIATSPANLQSMMNIAYAYACKWRFTFNVSKSCVLKFRAKHNSAPDKPILIGNSEIPYGQKYNH